MGASVPGLLIGTQWSDERCPLDKLGSIRDD
jgi:hypothetical protein